MEEEYSLEKTAEHLRQYAETKMDLIKLNISEKIASSVSSLSSIVLMTILSLFILLFLSVGTAVWINQKFVDPSMGFFVVGGFYVVLTLVLYISRESVIKNPLVNIILSKLYSDEEN